MSENEKRVNQRLGSTSRLSPMSCVLAIGDERIDLEIVNYHFRGASLRGSVGDYRPQNADAYLLFRIGNKFLPEKINFRITWETIGDNGVFGAEFSTESSFVLARAERFLTHSINTPVLCTTDPLDPNRKIYFKVLNISSAGALVSTSLSNKHLFPGMEFRNAVIQFPGIGSTELDAFIENSRAPKDEKVIHYGISIKAAIPTIYTELTTKYLSNLGSAVDNSERIEKLSEAGFVQKELRNHLTIREIESQEAYHEVLRLRFDGYKRAGKVDPNITWEGMGEGLKNEGVVLGAYLGGQLVASVELRFSKLMPLRLAEKVDIESVPALRGEEFVEINKLVVHPSAQKTDIVVGLFQKIHALTMLNGKPHGLLIAEDALVPLYSRLGSKKIGLSFEHPVKANTRLHVMIIPRSVYEDGNGINPLAWTQIYKNTHTYLSAVGLAREHHLTMQKRVFLLTTKFLLAILKRKKRSSKRQLKTEKVTSEGHETKGNIDPKWTKQHWHASVMLPYLLVADEMIGPDKVTEILLRYDFTRSYFSSAGNWLSVALFDAFIDEFKAIGDVQKLQELAGYRNLSKEVLGINHFLLKHFLTPREAFKAFGSYLPKFNKTRTYEVIESGATYSRIRIGLPDKSLRPKDASARHNWRAILDGHVRVITGSSADITELKSIFDGDPYCEYLVKWRNPAFSVRNIAIYGTACIGSAYLIKAYSSNLTTTSILGLSLMLMTGATAVALSILRSTKRKYRDIINSLSEFEKDADERYKELQNSKAILETTYQEGKLLEIISREIQNSEDLSNILDVSLNAICEKFDFRRVFVMIADSDHKYLRTAALRGAGVTSDSILNFKVDISQKRENPVVLSSVYHSGQSILITNAEEHRFHLNESSKSLIEALKTKSFAMVPIPATGKNWGVMIADKGENADVISRRDLVVLQRTCQSIGLALDKKAKIDSEVRVRSIFQRYVPSTVVESTLGHREPTLGGEKRDAFCLFLDIRNFTRLTEQLPSQLVVEILNKTWDALHKVVKESNGVIDKFLGDGALVTWGAVPGSSASSETIIKASLKFLTLLDAINLENTKNGLPQISVGIGIHGGQVISGNIGSNERMEFTVIGAPVNLASRLEQLTKVYDCNIVISEAVQPFENLSSDWQIHENISVRGSESSLRIATYRHKIHHTKKQGGAA